MKEEFYDFDPCDLDDEDSLIRKNTKYLEKEDDNTTTLDTWKPTVTQSLIKQSEWRKRSNAGCNNLRPDLDDLLKIRKYLKQRAPDSEIMQAFGITCETLVAIKKNRYCPVDGILPDELYQKYEEFRVKIKAYTRETNHQKELLLKSLSEKVNCLTQGVNYISNILFTTKEAQAEYKQACKKIKAEKKRNKSYNSNPAEV